MPSFSSMTVRSKKYEVFISFRGSDIRQTFLSHLHKALRDADVAAFVDDQLERGKEISESLLGEIEESHIALVIFSQNYAYSEWCLQELLKIAGCRNSTGQIVIPVFYGVDPSDVQNLTGSYGGAIAQHRANFDESLVESWRRVLKDTSLLSGLVSSNSLNDSNLIEEIVKHINHVLGGPDCLYTYGSSRGDPLVGINSRLEKVMSFLQGTDQDVCIVGIWGECGIGKTTLARATFDRICTEYDSQCFVSVREQFGKFAADSVQNYVVCKLFGTGKRILRKKAILVLDDVSDFDQINFLVHLKACFCPGSKIIVTSRDRHLLRNIGAEIYAIEKLDVHESVQLFCLNAFHQKVPPEGYLELSQRAVEYAQGLPLALQVLGSSLFQRGSDEFEDELEKLKGTSNHKILEMLRLSYDGLSDIEKEIFLDIACFFKGRQRDELESLFDVRGSKIGTSRLAEKALISICPGNWIDMHDLIQLMAKHVIREEKTLEKRRFLWDPDELYFLLTREMGTEAVRGLSLDVSKIQNVSLSPTAFQRLFNLKYLNFYASSDNAQLCAPQGLRYLPEQLRYLRWDRYPSKSLPLTSFCTEKLVELVMCGSQLQQLWDGVRNLPNLKRIDLSGSKNLIRLPNLSTAAKLAKLQLGYCSRLESLPNDICNLKSLALLDVSYCESLHELPLDFGNLESLEEFDAKNSGLKEFPESFCNLKKLKTLGIEICPNLHGLPEDFGNLKSLQYLHADGSGIKEVPSSINNLRELRTLSFSGCESLVLPPLTGDFRHLDYIDLSYCGLSEFPIDLRSVASLKNLYLSGNNFESIPESIQNLQKLQLLDVSNCNKLPRIPKSTQNLLSRNPLALNDFNIHQLSEYQTKLNLSLLCNCRHISMQRRWLSC